MRWERFFDDLEDQLASEREAERAVLDTEAERLRLARVTLRDRLLGLLDPEPTDEPPVFALSDGASVSAVVEGVGADWVALASRPPYSGALVVPLRAIAGISLSHADMLRSARARIPASRVAERVTFGFALRDLARRRAAVQVHTISGRVLAGTIDRAAADHFDLALHDPGTARRASEVTGHRLVPNLVVARIRVDGTAVAL